LRVKWDAVEVLTTLILGNATGFALELKGVPSLTGLGSFLAAYPALTCGANECRRWRDSESEKGWLWL